ncbi:DUF6406 domain-containing protein [Streptomyces spirodelae]|uniref:Uncharacterized protein n=1 Tax=Streptomyces spirodelae TaxID=2812904 RepID=A0ABS3WVY0_9ACTN|nr:DUF6406 domain-containing protein [Streptomyces spirodelae]MBO8187288.1 hypothetical protein [Streptomyces spirodelae]
MTRDKLVIRSGQVTTIGAGRIGGVSSVPPRDSGEAQVLLTILDVDGTERDEGLQLNDTFAVNGVTWRLADITYFTAGKWAAVAVPADMATPAVE